jgi:hypothetical protein
MGKNLDAMCHVNPRYTTSCKNWEKTNSVLDERRKHHWHMPKAAIVDVCVPGQSSLLENLCDDCPLNLAILIPCQRAPSKAEVQSQRDGSPPTVGTRQEEMSLLLPMVSGFPSPFAGNT